jgi:hypothetical protein
MSLPEEQNPLEEPLSPIGRMRSGLAASFVTPSPRKGNGGGDQFIHDKPFFDERKPSSTTVEKNYLNNGEHMLIPVTAKMIHSAVYKCKRFVLKDGRLLHMVKPAPKTPLGTKLLRRPVSTMASSGFGPYNGPWHDDAPTKHIGIMPTPWTMADALGLV